MTMLRAAALFAAPVLAGSHGNMLYPYAWWDANGKVGLTPGNSCAGFKPSNTGGFPKDVDYYAFCMWFADDTMIDGDVPETLADDSPLRTYLDIPLHPRDPASPCHDPMTFQGAEECTEALKNPAEKFDMYHRHPWKHPGKAPVWSPCGIGGGNPRGCFDYEGKPKPCDAGAASHGPDARFFPFADVKTTVWKMGGVSGTSLPCPYESEIDTSGLRTGRRDGLAGERESRRGL